MSSARRRRSETSAPSAHGTCRIFSPLLGVKSHVLRRASEAGFRCHIWLMHLIPGEKVPRGASVSHLESEDGWRYREAVSPDRQPSPGGIYRFLNFHATIDATRSSLPIFSNFSRRKTPCSILFCRAMLTVLLSMICFADSWLYSRCKTP